MSTSAKWAIGCGVVALLAGLLLVVLLVVVLVGAPDKSTVAVINVTGAIAASSDEAGLLGGGEGAETTITQLREATEDSSVGAIVVRLNTPGGSAAASQEIYDQMLRSRAKKPVIASMADVAASGGYYIAAGADTIYANPATVTGSIGVIFTGADLSGLLKKIGVQLEVVKSGKFKDIGSPNRPLTPAERALIQNLIDETYNQFVAAVAKGRKMPAAKVRSLADGRIYSGQQAARLGLVDKLGGLHDAIAEAGRRAGIKGEPEVKVFGPRSVFDRLFGTKSRGLVDRVYLMYYSLLGPRPLQ